MARMTKVGLVKFENETVYAGAVERITCRYGCGRDSDTADIQLVFRKSAVEGICRPCYEEGKGVKK